MEGRSVICDQIGRHICDDPMHMSRCWQCSSCCTHDLNKRLILQESDAKLTASHLAIYSHLQLWYI